MPLHRRHPSSVNSLTHAHTHESSYASSANPPGAIAASPLSPTAPFHRSSLPSSPLKNASSIMSYDPIVGGHTPHTSASMAGSVDSHNSMTGLVRATDPPGADPKPGAHRPYVPPGNPAVEYASHLSNAASNSLALKYAMPPDLSIWGADVTTPEDDDYIHNPDPARDRFSDHGGTILTVRGLINLGALLILAGGLIALFAGYPIASYVHRTQISTFGAFNIGGVNSTGQIPEIPGMSSLVDPDTPPSAYSRTGFDGKTKYQLVFSDEFNKDGRSFYPGDDPYWEAVDLHYWATQNVEWYDPAAITTANGSLVITMDEMENHDLNFRGGMLQSWNKFCFTGGYIEASIMLPGSPTAAGLWPAFWTMGNLGRAGYGATTEGMWPYSYDACDVGTLPNQTWPNGTPIATSWINKWKQTLSYMPGQRLSACTCPGEDHPGPQRSDGSWVGRSAPEIDVFEATVGQDAAGENVGQVSQSGQWAPFNNHYEILNVSGAYDIYDTALTAINTYTGSDLQQATSALTNTNSQAYQMTGGLFDTYGFEYEPGYDGYITWMSGGKPSWRLDAPAMGPDPLTEISRRPFPYEPLYIMLNLGASPQFTSIDWAHLKFPATMKVDYVRVYQDVNKINYGCSPPEYPTADYINKYAEAYNNPNLTTWRGTRDTGGYEKTFPKSNLTTGC